MGLIDLQDGKYACDQCGLVLDGVNQICQCSSEVEMTVIDDIGFGKVEIDLDEEINKENVSLAGALKSGNMRLAVLMRERIRDLVSKAPVIWRIVGDGRAIKRSEYNDQGSGVRFGAGQAGSPDISPDSRGVSPWNAGEGMATNIAMAQHIHKEDSKMANSPEVIKKGKGGGKKGKKGPIPVPVGEVVMTAEQVQAATVPAGMTKRSKKTVNQCACGCGRETKSIFAMGHDSKVKAVINKVDQGEIKVEELPDNIRKYYEARKQDANLKLSEWFGQG